MWNGNPITGVRTGDPVGSDGTRFEIGRTIAGESVRPYDRATPPSFPDWFTVTGTPVIFTSADGKEIVSMQTAEGLFNPAPESSSTSFKQDLDSKYESGTLNVFSEYAPIWRSDLPISEKVSNTWSVFNSARAAGDLAAAEAAAIRASNGRIELRQATRAVQSWGGGIVSQGIDKSLTAAQYLEKYKQPNPFDTFETVAAKASASRGSLNNLVRFGKVAGPAGILLVGYSAYSAIRNAPQELKGQAVAQETGGFLGGAAGSTVGTGLAAAAVIGGAALLAVSAPAWLVIGAGIGGGMLLGYGGSEGGRLVGGKIYHWFQ